MSGRGGTLSEGRGGSAIARGNRGQSKRREILWTIEREREKGWRVVESGYPEVSLQTRGIVIGARFVEFVFEKAANPPAEC